MTLLSNQKIADTLNSLKTNMLAYQASAKMFFVQLEISIQQTIEIFTEKTLPEFFSVKGWSSVVKQWGWDFYTGLSRLFSHQKRVKLFSDEFDYKGFKLHLICVPLDSSLDREPLGNFVVSELHYKYNTSPQECVLFSEGFRKTELEIARNDSLRNTLSSEIGGCFQEYFIEGFTEPYYPLESENRRNLIVQSNAYVQYAFVVWGYLGFYLTVLTSAMDGVNHIVQKKAPFLVKFVFGMARKGLDSIPSGHDIQSLLENVFKIHPRLEHFVPESFRSTVRFFIERSKELSSPWGVASNSVAQWISIFELFFQKTGDYFASWISLYKKAMIALGDLAIASPALAACITIALQISSLFILSNLCLYALSIAPPAVLYVASCAAMGISALFAAHLLYKGLHNIYHYFYPKNLGDSWTQELVETFEFNDALHKQKRAFAPHAYGVDFEEHTVSVPLPEPHFTDYAQDSHLVRQLDRVCETINNLKNRRHDESQLRDSILNHYSLYQYASFELFKCIQYIFQLENWDQLTVVDKSLQLKKKLSDLDRRVYNPSREKTWFTNTLDSAAFGLAKLCAKMQISMLQWYFSSSFYGENLRAYVSRETLNTYQGDVMHSLSARKERLLIFVSPENRLAYERAITHAHQDYLKQNELNTWLQNRPKKSV